MHDTLARPVSDTVSGDRFGPGSVAVAIILGSTLLAAIAFRTYGLEVAPLSMELVRHFGLFFLLAELAVIAISCAAGLRLGAALAALRRTDRMMLAAWLALFWIGSTLAAEPSYALTAVISWPIHVLFGFAVWHLACREHVTAAETAQRVASGMAIVLCGSLVLTALHFAAAPEQGPLPGGKVFWSGAIPGFMSVRLFGVVVGYAGLFGAGLLLCRDTRSANPLAAFLAIVGFAAMAWSSTRAMIPAVGAALLFVPIVAGHRASVRQWLRVAGCLVAGFGLSILISAPDASFGTLAMLHDAPVSSGSGDFTSGRGEIWRTAAHAIARQPLFGTGEGSIRWLLASSAGGHVQPHNLLLQLFMHWGIPAAIAALWLLGRSLFAMIRAVRADPALLPFAMIVVAALVAALFDGALYYPQMVMLPAAALAFVLGRSGAPRRS